MDDPDFSQPAPPPLTLDEFRVLRLIAQSGADMGKLPLRFKFDRGPLDKLIVDGLVEQGDSGWPDVPGYRITKLGGTALQAWLAAQRQPPK